MVAAAYRVVAYKAAGDTLVAAVDMVAAASEASFLAVAAALEQKLESELAAEQTIPLPVVEPLLADELKQFLLPLYLADPQDDPRFPSQMQSA